jgi:nucleotide-binding universal stress UspA family protein
MQTSKQNERYDEQVVVAGIDLSEQSGAVLQRAAHLASASGGELHIAHVIPTDAVPSQGQDPLRFLNLTDDIRVKLERLVRELPESVKSIVMHVRNGKPDVQIAQLASDIKADLVVVGTHGRRGLERLILGSVAESLVRNAPCAVLVCRSKEPIQPWEQIAPPCPDCLAVQRSSARKMLWCERHAQHHPRAHTYSELPATFGIGSQTLR